MGFTSKQYLDYMFRIAIGEEDAFAGVSTEYNADQIQEQNKQDFLNLQNDLKPLRFQMHPFLQIFELYLHLNWFYVDAKQNHSNLSIQRQPETA